MRPPPRSPREPALSEWAHSLWHPGCTASLLVFSLMVTVLTAGVASKLDMPDRPDPRYERRRTLIGYNKNGDPVYAEPRDFETKSWVGAVALSGGVIAAGSLGLLVLQLIGAAAAMKRDGPT